MSEYPSLLAPVEIRVLVIGAPPGKRMFSNISYDYARLDEEPLSQIIETSLFSEREDERPGVHLHWRLPEGFTKGVQDPDSGEITYPPVPNRWLVTRLALTKGAGKLASKSFLIQSDILQKQRGSDNAESATHPFIEDEEQPYRYLGRRLDPSNPVPPRSERIRLTAVSPGNPFFAAHYHSCINVFALHDNPEVEGLKNCNLAYVVCGWYEDSIGADPVAGMSTPGELEEMLGMSIDGDIWPKRTICHGAIGNIEWKGPDVHYPSGVPDDPAPGQPEIRPRLAIGNSSAEALSALMAPNDANDERVCHIFLSDALPSLVSGNGISTTERSLHERSFTVVKPPDIAGIKRKANREDAPPPEPSAMDKIAGLRKRQRVLFDDYNRFLQEQRAAYETWYLYTFALDDSCRLSHLECLRNNFEKLPAISAELENRAAMIKSEIASFNLDGYTLEDEPDQRYYVPNEPVIVVSQPVHRPTGSDGELLHCRTSPVIIRSLSLEVGTKTISLEAVSLYEGLEPVIPVPNETARLTGEALLLIPGFSGFLAERAYARAGIVPTAVQLELLDRTIKKLQRGEFDARVQPFSGVLPDDIAIRSYEPLWSPLFLEWQACYYPDTDLLQHQPDLRNWSFDGQDYFYTGRDDLINTDNERIIEGRMLISDNASRQLDAMICLHLPDQVDDTRQGPRQTSNLSQAFSGLHSHMLMREESLPLALFTTDKSEKHITRLISTLSPDVLGTKPVFDGLFAPIRAGFLSLNRIRIIDTFGRFQDINQPEYHASESMRPPGARTLLRHAMLPPRLLQPSRLLAYWICSTPGRTSEEASFVSTASPVCGYLQANHIDHSLIVFSEDGTLKGSLNLVETGSGIIWKSPPGAPFSTEIPEDMNPEMVALLAGMRENGQTCLAGLLEYIDTLFYTIHPPPHQSHEAELISRPLAVVRAAVKLEQLGKKEWYRHNQEARSMDPSHATNPESAIFPLEVGNKEDPRDGMVGFFLNGNYGNIHIYDGIGSGINAPYFVKDNKINISPHPDHLPQYVTLLMEPRCCVNLVSGILPTGLLRLPEELVEKSLARMCAAYMVAPVICHEDHPSLPVPRMENTDIVWNHLEHDAGWMTTVLEQKEPEATCEQGRLLAMEGFMQMVRRKEDEK